MWMSTGGRQIMIARENARLWLAGIMVMYNLGILDFEVNPAYAPGFERGAYDAMHEFLFQSGRAILRGTSLLTRDIQDMYRRITNSNAIP
jgi:hypothetical protein